LNWATTMSRISSLRLDVVCWIAIFIEHLCTEAVCVQQVHLGSSIPSPLHPKARLVISPSLITMVALQSYKLQICWWQSEYQT
jgi:hypothetical protein